MAEPELLTELRDLPRSERREALEDLVRAMLRESLLMDEDEDIPDEQSFFELGLTSLLLSDMKERLETALCCQISTNVFFNQPTVAQIVTYLQADVLEL